MKKLIVPVLLVLFAMGLSQREAKAGFSIGISIGDSHRHSPPVVVAPRPVIISRPPVVVAAPVCEPPRVIVRECETYPYGRYDRYDRHDRYDHRRDYRRESYRHEPPRHGNGRR
jgi:hypothetical protein